MKKGLVRAALSAAFVGAFVGMSAFPGSALAAGISNDVVKIGVLTDMSGVYSAIGGEGSVTAAKMAVADFGGTVLGKPIDVISADHQNKPDIASTKARQWADTDHVDMITGLLNSGAAIAVQKIGTEKKMITMATGAGSTALTNKDCGPYGIHYVYDTYSLPKVAGSAIVQHGGKTWFFLTADYAFGHSLEKNTAAFVKSQGGKVLGQVRHPLATADFSSYLLQAQASGAKVIGLANAGGDFVNAVKQAREFGIVQGGQTIAGMLVFLSDVKSLGLDVAQGMEFATSFYWDRDPASRAWSKRYFAKTGAMPTMDQAGVYSATMTYLKAIKAAGTDDPDAVMKTLRGMKIDDFFSINGHLRADGTMVHDMFLVEVKKPSESKGPWDLLKVIKQVPGDQAFMPMSEGTCPLVKAGGGAGTGGY
ncbi:ABC transporter substrate-binding protein [Varunaivibrio sulfuroxidans]|uniref:Amino acid/amide ABC transporter substrate-binding protein (HAAT family) n=1 Tax=Varunaivibrio sulfuroxidans TaxID=1773489 RepID=A0A4R3JI09_9PROT|nr:ABC transporter substrate-binding protein [Varunaivibrio sulfuroxidans]TCS64896.1 amino acid/amide ABC transporter substrate-binding protein (HAAT family) [Varunaivibrio sulfuroxidans]WES29809.1 ABC transporter substrate-binding protein [Varunaivibrio sulfuroxidans]